MNQPNKKYTTDYMKGQHIINAIKRMPNKVFVVLERERHFNCSFGEMRFDLALEIFLQVGLSGRGNKEGGGCEWQRTKTQRQEAQGNVETRGGCSQGWGVMGEGKMNICQCSLGPAQKGPP